MKQFIAAFTISKNHSITMQVSPLIVGKEAVEKFYKDYCSLPESERCFLVNDIFLYDDIEKANEDHEYAVYREECNNNIWYTGYAGNVYQDKFEQSTRK